MISRSLLTISVLLASWQVSAAILGCTDADKFMEPCKPIVEQAEKNWQKAFNDTGCSGSSLAVNCASNGFSVACEVAPKARPGDGSCYELMLSTAFIPADKNPSGQVVEIGNVKIYDWVP